MMKYDKSREEHQKRIADNPKLAKRARVLRGNMGNKSDEEEDTHPLLLGMTKNQKKYIVAVFRSH